MFIYCVTVFMHYFGDRAHKISQQSYYYSTTGPQFNAADN